MENPNPDETSPMRLPADGDNSSQREAPLALPKPRRSAWFKWTLLGLVGLLLVAAVSGYSGYQSGIDLRQQAEATQLVSGLSDQFQLAVQDIGNQNYDLARQRLEYIIRNQPGYPGAQEKLAEVLTQLNTTATPTPQPTPTLVPTPDNRSQQDLFSQAQQSLQNSSWTDTIDTLLALRKADPTFQVVTVDDMLYIALRNRGVDKILKDGDLEGGIYDLSLAQRFGPLDAEANSYLTWARIYILGASFWQIDWQQAINYFSQVAPAMPGMRDGSGMTSAERYRQALIGYGDQLAGEEKWCKAVDQYNTALGIGTDQNLESKLSEASSKCGGDSSNNNNNKNDNQAPVETAPSNEQPPPTPYPAP
jgi:type II secretory pathway pseudopilin PulG